MSIRGHIMITLLMLLSVLVGCYWAESSGPIPAPPKPLAEDYSSLTAHTLTSESAPVGEYAAIPRFTGSDNVLVGFRAGFPMTTGENTVYIGRPPKKHGPRGPKTPAEWSAWINTWVTRHPKFTLVKPVTPEIMQKAFDWAFEQKCNLQKTLDGWRTFLAQHDPTECPHGGGCYNLCIGLHACQSSTYTTDHSRTIWIDP